MNPEGLKLFGKKKKNKLFGNTIEPECIYCGNYAEKDKVCRLGFPLDAAACGKFIYDPLKRTPIDIPPLKQHDPDEFKL